VSAVTFVDTSVLCELLAVPGKSDPASGVRQEVERRARQGERFVIPVTAVIETGNHIAQASSGDRHAAALRLGGLLQAARAGDPSFLLHQFTWDGDFLDAVIAGDSTGQTFAAWAAAKQMGTGDLAILVERDRFVATTAMSRADVTIWTLDDVLAQYT